MRRVPAALAFAAVSMLALGWAEGEGPHWISSGPWEGAPASAARLSDLVEDPARPGRILAVSASGLFASEDEGRSWRLLSDAVHGTLDASPAEPGVWLGGSSSGIARSVDDGLTWVVVPSAFDGGTVDEVKLDPLRPGLALSTVDGALWRSEDAGATWSDARASLPSADARVSRLFPDPQLYGRWFVSGSVPQAGDWRSILLVSTDHGDSWFEVTDGLDCTIFEPWYCRRGIGSVAVSRFRTEVTLIGGATGVWSGDGLPGGLWRRASDGLPEPICPLLPGELPCSGVRALVAHPTRPGVVFATVYENPFGPLVEERLGMFWSVDGARTWHRFPARGLPPLAQLHSAMVTRDGRFLVAAHRDGGVWVYPLAEALNAPRRITGRRSRP